VRKKKAGAQILPATARSSRCAAITTADKRVRAPLFSSRSVVKIFQR